MDIQLPQIIFQALNFSIVLGALIYLLYKPVQKILDERAQKVADSQKEVGRIEEEGEKIEALKAKTKREAEKQATEILENAKKTATKREQELIDQAKLNLQGNLKAAEARWQEEKKQLVAGSKAQMVDAVMQVSGMVLGKKLNKKTDKKMIEDGLKEVLANL
ncbi:MAG: ATP synthase F0 subunit B [Candidatus Paceibacterota bacterium]